MLGLLYQALAGGAFHSRWPESLENSRAGTADSKFLPGAWSPSGHLVPAELAAFSKSCADSHVAW